MLSTRNRRWNPSRAFIRYSLTSATLPARTSIEGFRIQFPWRSCFGHFGYSNMANALRTVVILIFAWSVGLWTDKQPLSAIGKRAWIFLILSGIATGLYWLCYFRALQLGEASRVAPVDKLSVIVAIALAAIFLRELLTWHQWVGGALIFTGAIVLAYV